MRLIDADKLNWRLGVNQNDKRIFYITGEDIDAAPTIDPESLRPRGHWESPSKLLNILTLPPDSSVGSVKPHFGKVKYVLSKSDERLVFNSEKEACEAMGVHKCSIASCHRRGYKCKGYEISKLENERNTKE